MNLLAFKTETELEVLQCQTCGTWHAIPTIMFKRCQEHGGFYHCPNGHSWGWQEGSLVDQLQKEKKRREFAENDARAQKQLAEKMRLKVEAAEKILKTTKKRHAAGVCPCCKRTFSALGNHMRKKHPEYKP